jgi:hypothetical protein
MHILFHRPTPWTSTINCSTKIYSRLFSQLGYKVSYLQSNINLIHYFFKYGYFKVWNQGNRFENNIWVCSCLSLFPYLDNIPIFSKYFIKLSYLITIPPLRKEILNSGYGEPDFIWTTIPGSTYLKKVFPKSKLIFHCIDNYSAYRGSTIKSIESDDYDFSDHIFVIGESLSNFLTNEYKIDPNKITNLGQGVNIKAYSKKYKKPEELNSFKGPIAIWVGVLSKIDFDLFKIVSKHLAEKNGAIIIIGPNTTGMEFSGFNNIKYLGPKSSSDIPRFLQYSDIGLMLYNRKNKEIYKGQHPLKLYEYCAAGLEIISTPHSEFEYIKPPVNVIQNESDLEKLMKNILSLKLNKNIHALKFAEENSWSKCRDKANLVLKNL